MYFVPIRMHFSRALLLFLLVVSTSCGRFGAVYPPRPVQSPSPPIADPAPSRIVTHVSVTSSALKASLDDAVPKIGEGTFALGGQRRYWWQRAPLELSFSQGRIVLDAHVTAKVDMGLASPELAVDLHVVAEPVINTEYAVKLQSVDVKATSSDRKVKVADSLAGVLDLLSTQVAAKLKDFSQDLRPTIEKAYARVAVPIPVPIGDAKGCALLKVVGIEAGPTVVADGIEKDLAIVVAPSVTIPCAEPDANVPLPPLSNVATLVPGPFTVTVPVAASYDELTRAMGVVFTDGKYFFSTEYPKLYLEKPDLYESEGKMVLKMHITGPVHKFGIDADLDGDLFLTGHLSVVDNELSIPDLEPTIETKNFLLSLKAMSDGDKIRDQARAAMRLDLGERLAPVRDKLGADLTFGDANGCFKGDVDKLEITGAYPHGSYVRIYVAVTARTSASMPCATPPAPAPAPAP